MVQSLVASLQTLACRSPASDAVVSASSLGGSVTSTASLGSRGLSGPRWFWFSVTFTPRTVSPGAQGSSGACSAGVGCLQESRHL